ncbi:UNVERIFIED_CONTAM: hypothetical protein Scaly_0673900 [Sesamum calycinum]|uniref:Uncharacterized protein n=1 Tax=Sesamum calycinum TaxID=2727403 RepID=A0AAW2R6V0_9LAMI
MVKGYTIRPGVGFEETYSPVVMTKSIWIMLPIAAWEAYWIAVKTLLKYLKRTEDMFLIYSGGELILEGYSSTSFHSIDDEDKSEWCGCLKKFQADYHNGFHHRS